jgi:uncharacterized membrane protein
MPDGSNVGGQGGNSGPAGDPFGRPDRPELALVLWPNRSASRKSWTWVMGLAAAGLALPLVGLAGTSAAWGMLPFLAAVLVGLGLAVRRNHLDGRLREELKLWPDLITVVRRDPDGRERRWHASPFWVRLKLRDAHVESYLTLEGNGREIELGAFLSPWEREALHADLAAALKRVRTPASYPRPR